MPYPAARDLVMSLNSNHVIQACLKMKLPADKVDFIRHELEKDIVFYCGHQSACRVVQMYITHYGKRLNLEPLLENNHHIQLAEMEYGNHVIQCILGQSCFFDLQRKIIADMLQERNVLRLSKGKQGSHVIESCIRVAGPKLIESLTHCVCAHRGRLLRRMAMDEFGNYVLRTLFSRCCPRLKGILTASVNRRVVPLDSLAGNMHNQTEFMHKVFRFHHYGA